MFQSMEVEGVRMFNKKNDKVIFSVLDRSWLFQVSYAQKESIPKQTQFMRYNFKINFFHINILGSLTSK